MTEVWLRADWDQRQCVPSKIATDNHQHHLTPYGAEVKPRLRPKFEEMR